MVRRFAILGAAGDLASRYLLPALARLHEAGHLPAGFQVTGISQDDWSTGHFRRHVADRLERFAAGVGAASRQAIVSMLDYRSADVTDPAAMAAALDWSEEPVAIYLALPPFLFVPTIRTLIDLRLAPSSPIVVEKPFGENLESARTLNHILHEGFPEKYVFRIDHFLGEQTVQNILGLRFANRIFEPVWNRQHVERVEIVWDETLGLEGRASYYDRTGALRDMIQNHLLQLLCLVGMEPPVTLNEQDLRDRKNDLLRAVRRLSPEEVERWTVRARYTGGQIGDLVLPAYVDEPGVDPARDTETFAQITLWVDNWRWAGVPFVLRSGKALAKNRWEIAVHFQPVPHLAFGQVEEPHPNVLRLEIDPDRIALDLNINVPGSRFGLQMTEVDSSLAPAPLPAYALLLLDVLEGDPTLFIRDDEAEESWRIVEPILEAWDQHRVPLREYPAGSDFTL
jgi:glucose-6-phosphate 1-dehydrogenase